MRPPNAAGTVVERTSRTIAWLAGSFWPVPAIVNDTSATVPSRDGVTVDRLAEARDREAGGLEASVTAAFVSGRS